MIKNIRDVVRLATRKILGSTKGVCLEEILSHLAVQQSSNLFLQSRHMMQQSLRQSQAPEISIPSLHTCPHQIPLQLSINMNLFYKVCRVAANGTRVTTFGRVETKKTGMD